MRQYCKKFACIGQLIDFRAFLLLNIGIIPTNYILVGLCAILQHVFYSFSLIFSTVSQLCPTGEQIKINKILSYNCNRYNVLELHSVPVVVCYKYTNTQITFSARPIYWILSTDIGLSDILVSAYMLLIVINIRYQYMLSPFQ